LFLSLLAVLISRGYPYVFGFEWTYKVTMIQIDRSINSVVRRWCAVCLQVRRRMVPSEERGRGACQTIRGAASGSCLCALECSVFVFNCGWAGRTRIVFS
jgi:hypothetical protein